MSMWAKTATNGESIRMCEPNEIDPAITQLEQDLRAQGWSPVEMIEPFTGTLFTRWYPPGKPIPSLYREFGADNYVNNSTKGNLQK